MSLRREVALVFLLFVVLGLVYTYPLVWYFSTGLPYTRFPDQGNVVKWMRPADTLQLYYWFWLMKDNLTGGSRLFTNPYEFDVTPVLPPQRYGFYQFPLSLLFVLLSPLGGAFAYNSMVILSFPLAGLTMYLLVRCYMERRGAALVAALIFVLAPFRLGELLGGHSNGFLFFLFPLTLYCYEMGLRRRGLAFGVLAGLCLVSLALTDFHLLYYLLLFSAGYWAIRAIEALDLPWRDGLSALGRAAARSPGCLAVPLAVASVVGSVVALVLRRRGVALLHILPAVGAGVVSVAAAWLFSAVIYMGDLGPGSPGPASGGPSRGLRRGAFTLLPLLILSLYSLSWIVETQRLGRLLVVVAFVGVVLLQLPGLLRRLRSQWEGVRRLLHVLLPVTAATLLCVGYVLWLKSTIMGRSFTATGGRPYALVARFAPALSDLLDAKNPGSNVYLGVLPALLGFVGLAQWRREAGARATLGIYGAGFLLGLILSLGPTFDPILPLYRLLYNYFPYFNYPRDPTRLMIITGMALAVLAGYALRRLPTGRPWARVVLLALAVGVGLEYAPFRPVGITLVDPGNPLYRTVGRELGDGRFLAIPLFPGDSHQSSVYEFYVTTTRATMINGYNPLVSHDYVQKVFDRLVNLNLGEMRPAEYELLKTLRVKFLMVHEELFFWKVSPFPGALTVENLQASPYLTLRGRAGDRTLFELRQEPAGPPQRFNRSSPVGILYEFEEWTTRIGREVIDLEASNRRAVVVEEGRDGPGSLVLDGGAPYPSGTYVAAFRLRVDGSPPGGSVASVSVSADRGRRILAQREIMAADFNQQAGYEEFDLPWTVEVPTRVAFRIDYRGVGTLRADRVYVTFLDRIDPAPGFEAEALLLLRTTGELRADPEALGGSAVYVAGGTPESRPIFGPYRRYPPGEYEAFFRLKLDQDVEGMREVAVIDVSADRDRRQLAVQPVTGRDLSPPGRYHAIRLPFIVDRLSVLEFRILHRGNTGLWIDHVTVRTAGSRR